MILKIHLVDTGVLLTNWTERNPEAMLMTVRSIIEEIKNRPSIQRIESLVSIGRLSVEDVHDEYVRESEKAAIETGDISVLSPQDLELLGLAYGKSHQGNDVVVVSADIAVLNVARHIGLDIIDPKGKITHDIKWIMKCPACGNSSHNTKQIECDVCGTKMKRRPTSSKKIR